MLQKLSVSLESRTEAVPKPFATFLRLSWKLIAEVVKHSGSVIRRFPNFC